MCSSDLLRKKLKENIEINTEKLRNYLLDGLKKANKRACDVDRFLGTNGMAGHYFGRSQWGFPTREAYEKLQGFLCLPTPYLEIYGLQQLLESLQSLQSLESLQSLSVTQKDYREIAIAKDSVIYCDIPYKNTNGYGKKDKTSDFDYEAFYSWCEKQTELVVISEYEMPADRFIRVAFTQKRQRLNGKGAGQLKEEGLFIPRGQVELYNAMTRGVSLAEEKAQGRLFDCA